MVHSRNWMDNTLETSCFSGYMESACYIKDGCFPKTPNWMNQNNIITTGDDL